MLTIFTIIFMTQVTSSNVKIYNKNDKKRHCYDRGSYNIFCESTNNPETVTCRFDNKWDCTPSENKDWEIHHIHTCFENSCTLYTVGIPKNEFHPAAMLIIIFMTFIFVIFR
jgi:hypothetical protein